MNSLTETSFRAFSARPELDNKTAHSREREEFVALAAGPFRKELTAHCYRMLGSFHDAEDLVQDTFLRAWRAFDQFEPGRGSLRTWLYRIATNACLSALKERRRRRLPSEVVARRRGPRRYPTEKYAEATWVTPFPDLLAGPASDDPAVIAASRSAIRLAFITALQHLPARQRAALILRDVLTWKAAEVAELLDTTPTAVNSVLQRARAQLAQVAPIQDDVAEPSDAEQRVLLNRYVMAFENADLPTLTALLSEHAVMEMPPWLHWLAGHAVTRFIARILFIARAGRLASGAHNRQRAAIRGRLCTRRGQCPTRAVTSGVHDHRLRHQPHRRLL